MMILWIRKSKKGERTCLQPNDKGSFQKHDEDMKRFRLAHPKIETESPKDIMTADGLILAPVRSVKLSEHVQN